MSEVVQTDLTPREIQNLAALGQANLGAPDSVAPLSFLDFDDKGDPRVIKANIQTRDLIGGTTSLGESATNKAKATYNGMSIKNKFYLKGCLETDDQGVQKLLAERYAKELVDQLLSGKDSFSVDDTAGTLNIGDTSLTDVRVNGKKGALKELNIKPTPKTGFWGATIPSSASKT